MAYNDYEFVINKIILSLCLFWTRCVYETCHDQSRCFEI